MNLETGKYYEDGDGVQWGPLEPHGFGGLSHKSRQRGRPNSPYRTWRSNGQWQREKSSEDLVAEVFLLDSESHPVPAQDFKGAAGTAKPQLHLIPPVAMTHLAAALADGARRYGAWNWRGTRIMSSTYISAMMRHIDAYRGGEDLTTDSKVHHLGSIMANCAILLDAMEHGCLEDDRPKKPEKKMSPEEIARAMGVGS